MKNSEISVPYEYSDMNRTLPETLFDCIRKSVSLRKSCSKHKMYLCFESTHCQNFKTIAWPPAEISVIEEKQRINYGFHSNNFRKRKFCDQLPNAWALNFWTFRHNPASRSWVIYEWKSNWCPIVNGTRCLLYRYFSPENTRGTKRPITSIVNGRHCLPLFFPRKRNIVHNKYCLPHADINMLITQNL